LFKEYKNTSEMLKMNLTEVKQRIKILEVRRLTAMLDSWHMNY